MPSLSAASEYYGINQKWLRDGVEMGAKILVVIGLNGQCEYWPRYYKKGDAVPFLHQRLGVKYAHMVVDLTGITLDDPVPAATV